MKSRYVAVGLFIFCILTLSTGTTRAILGPGWHNEQGEPVTPEEARALREKAAQESPDEEAPEAPGGSTVDEITLEIQELARGLLHDPKLIYEFVHNHIDYQPYYGTLKGATLTLLECSGNDFDQATLLVALLRESGFTANYKFGTMEVPANAPDDIDVDHWLGVDPNAAAAVFSNGGIPTTKIINGMGDTIRVRLDRVWVEVNIGGTNYLMDPAFKTYTEIPGIDLSTALAYNQAQLLAAAGGTSTADYVQNLNSSALNTKLVDFATNLVSDIRANHPNASVEEIIGGRKIDHVDLSAFSTTLPFTPVLQNTWTSIPASFNTTVRFELGNIDVTIPTGTIHGRRISLTFATSGIPRAILWLDDTALAQETGTAEGTEVDMTVSVDHPYPANGGTFQDREETNAFLRDGSYTILYGFGGSACGKLLKKRQQQLDEYRAQGLADTSPEVVTESLNVMGLSWMHQTALILDLLDQLGNVITVRHHRFGRMGQVSGYFVDVGLQSVTTSPKSSVPVADHHAVFRARSLFASAMEHGVIEQLQDNASASTIKFITLANGAGDKIFYATDTNYAGTVRPQLTDYATGTLDFFQARVDAGAVIILPQDGLRAVDQWSGTGYISHFNVPGFVQSIGMIISGNYFGGFAGTPGQVDPDGLESEYTSGPGYHNGEPPYTGNPTSPDPVDLHTGAFLLAHTDLRCGNNPDPLGLAFSRSYSSNRNRARGSLGFGWSHNYESSLVVRSDKTATLGGATPVDVTAFAAAAIAVLDLMENPGDARDWVTASLISGWAVDLLKDNAVSVIAQGKPYQFIKLADGSYSPPAGVTTNLIESGGLFQLQEHSGSITQFNSEGRVSTYTDIDGNSMSYTYDINDRLENVTDAYGRSFTFAYNLQGLIDTITEQAGAQTRSVSYSYSPGGDLTGFTDPENETWTYAYDGDHRITETKDAGSAIIARNFYDAMGRVMTQQSQGLAANTWEFFISPFRSTQEDPQGNRNSLYFDDHHRQVAEEDALGSEQRSVYDGQGNVVMSTDPLGRVTTFSYDGNGNLLLVTDHLGNEHEFTYDAQNRLHFAFDPADNAREYRYDSENHITRIIDATLNESVFTYHPDGLLASKTDRNGNTYAYTYDSFGNSDVVTRPDTSSFDSDFSPRGDLLMFTDANGNPSTHTYDDRRNLLSTTNQQGFGEALTYDASGRRMTHTDEYGKTSSFTYDSLNRIVSMQGSNGGITTRTYDTRDLMVSSVDPVNQSLQIQHDGAGRITRTISGSSSDIEQGYDAIGNRTSVVNQNEETTTLAYDELNRIVGTTTPLGRDITSTYDSRNNLKTIVDESGRSATYQYDDHNWRTGVTDDEGAISYTYDNEGHLLTVTEGSTTITREYNNLYRLTRFVDAHGSELEFEYDGIGNLTKVIYPDDKEVSYTYDSGNRLTSVVDWMARTTTYSYNTGNRLESITRPNNTRREYAYNGNGELSQISEFGAGNSLITRFDLTYDAASRLVGETTTPPQPFGAPSAASTTYDADNRVATHNGMTVVHDQDGNMTTGPIDGVLKSFTYDDRHRLVSLDGETYVYDAEGTRISVTDASGTTDFTVNPNAVFPQILVAQNGATTTRYVYGLTGLLYEDTVGVMRGYHFDFRGSTVALTDNSGNVSGSAYYSPYGQVVARTGQTETRFLYNGAFGVQTDQTGLCHMRARYYHPELRRFISADPIGFAGGVNWYQYAGGNPVTGLDPLGLDGFEIVGPSWEDLMNAAQLIGGAAEVAAGLSLTAATGGSLIGPGGLVAAHGVDTMQSALQSIWYGTRVDSGTSHLIQATGAGRNTANLIDAGLGVVGSGLAGGYAAVKSYRAASASAEAGATWWQIFRSAELGGQAVPNRIHQAWEAAGITSDLEKARLIREGALRNVGVFESIWDKTVGSVRLWFTGGTVGGAAGTALAGSGLGTVRIYGQCQGR